VGGDVRAISWQERIGKIVWVMRRQLAERLHLRVGTEVAGPVALDTSHQRHPGYGLLPRDADIGVPLVVLETDVVRRLVLADERRLEMKRVPLGIDRR